MSSGLTGGSILQHAGRCSQGEALGDWWYLLQLGCLIGSCCQVIETGTDEMGLNSSSQGTAPSVKHPWHEEHGAWRCHMVHRDPGICLQDSSTL